jgi:ubiquitin-conjugating enzyme E2 Z
MVNDLSLPPHFFRHVAIDEEDVTHVEALIIGPPDTPYDGGFFHFGK